MANVGDILLGYMQFLLLLLVMLWKLPNSLKSSEMSPQVQNTLLELGTRCGPGRDVEGVRVVGGWPDVLSRPGLIYDLKSYLTMWAYNAT